MYIIVLDVLAIVLQEFQIVILNFIIFIDYLYCKQANLKRFFIRSSLTIFSRQLKSTNTMITFEDRVIVLLVKEEISFHKMYSYMLYKY